MRPLSSKSIVFPVLAVLLVATVSAGLLWPRLAQVTSHEARSVSTQLDDQPLTSREKAINRGGAVQAACRLPRSADLIVVVEHGAELRNSRLGAAAAQFLQEAQGLNQSREAWSVLAAQLDWSESETFDQLLGGRVSLVSRASADGKTMLWVLLSDVSIDTDIRLKQRLESAQRSIDQGHQILSIEKGKYELTSHRHTTISSTSGTSPAANSRDDRTVTIVLGPTGQSELFDELVAMLAQGAKDPLTGTDVLEVAGAAGEAEVLVLGRLVGGPTQSKDNTDLWSRFFMLAGRRSDPLGAELEARFVYRDPSRRESNLAIKPTSDASFRALSSDALLTIVQAAHMQDILGVRNSAIDFLRELPLTLPDGSGPLMGLRQTFSLRRVGESSTTAKGSDGSSVPITRCAAMLALETTSPPKLARLLDGSIARFVHSLEQGSGMQQPIPFNFLGKMPEVTRLLPVRMGEGNLLRLFTTDPVAFAWSYPTADDPDSGDVHGWWVLTIAPMPDGQEGLPGEIHREASKAVLSNGIAGQLKRWIWLGAARPVEVEKLLPSLIPDIAGVRSAMKRFETLKIELSISESGDIQGDVGLRLADTKP